MPLRVKVLALFLLLGMLPLLGLGAVEYFRSLRAVEALLVAQNARLAERVSTSLSLRTKRLESDLLLLSENAESQRWLRRTPIDTLSAMELQRFLELSWTQLRGYYREVRITDVAGRSLSVEDEQFESADVLAPFVRTIRDEVSGRELGTVQVRPRLSSLLRAEEVAPGFGERGRSAVIDLRTGTVLYQSSDRTAREELPAVLGVTIDLAQLTAPAGSLQFVSGDTAFVAAFRAVPAVPWTVVMSAALPEFTAPLATVGRSTILTFGGVAVLASLLFGALVGRVTRSLEELTSAAALVGQGNFSPTLPQAGVDEVGRLSGAFASMVRRIRDMMDEIRTQRQMAVLGEFAAQLSHEVRNPLTAIKLNLQRIERALRSQETPGDVLQSMHIARREVDRLDEVVRGVLQLARVSGNSRVAHSLNGLLSEVCEMVQDQCTEQQIVLALNRSEGSDLGIVDSARLKGAILNLMNNALEAMPHGGHLTVTSQCVNDTWIVTISDSGPGIAPERRNAVFFPFETTKDIGTGLGLPLARRAIEEQDGTLELVATPPGTGATFMIRIPLNNACINVS